MSWIDKVQSWPLKKRIRVLWISVVGCAAILLAAWIAVGNYNPRGPKDTSFFKALGGGIKSFGSQDFKGQIQKAQDQAKQQLNSENK